MATLASIRTSPNKIEIINQLLLPHTTEWLQIDTIEQAHDAIKTMKVRGRRDITVRGWLMLPTDSRGASHSIPCCSNFSQYLSRALKADPRPPFLSSPEALKSQVTLLLDFLYTARPTAVNLGAATRRISRKLQAFIDAGNDVLSMAQDLVEEGNKVADEDVGRNKEMAKCGGEWLVKVVKSKGGSGEGLNVLTVCNTGSLATSGYGTALGLITYLHETGKLDRAYFTQTAPYHQGSRLTALELQTLKIPSTMIVDTMVGSLFQHHDIHAVAVGADRIARNGDTANKIGTYNAAVLAARHKIPFIVVAPITTVDLDLDDGSKIPIEHRPPLEACIVRGALYPPSLDAQGNKQQAAVMITPEGLNGIYNPSFDVTPAELISAIVTEKGVAVKGADGKFHLSGIV